MIKPYDIKVKRDFVGRDEELQLLANIDKAGHASIVTVYGRRRVGKTELLEQAYRTRNVLKFEGIEGWSEQQQMQQVLLQLAEYTGNSLYRKINIIGWSEILKIIAELTSKGKWTVYFEEVQWLAEYKNNFIAELKYVWDNYFRHNDQLIIILCGSSPSFMINSVVKSKALYNRSQYTIALKKFSLAEARNFLKKSSLREVMDAYLTVGGVPEYLSWLKCDSSVFLSLCQNTFMPESFFLNEQEKIFVSSLSANKYHRRIINFLSKRHFATRAEIVSHLKLTSGGTVSSLLEDLETCDFIIKYTPFNLRDSSSLARYSISDEYLQFYFKFVEPTAKSINNGDYNKNPTFAINSDTYSKWLGYAFERMCRKNHRLIARILGFESVKYRSGVFFNRSTNASNPGYQLDLVFDRDDNVYTICEIKYLQSKVSSKVIAEFERKLVLFSNPRNKTIQKILITCYGADSSLINRGYFDRVIQLEDLF